MRSTFAGVAFAVDAFVLYWLVFVYLVPVLSGLLGTEPWSWVPVVS